MKIITEGTNMNAIVHNYSGLVRYDAACRALADAKSVDEVKELRDIADVMRGYARQAKNRQLEMDAAEIRIRAERRLGEMLRDQKFTVGLNTGAMGIGTSAVPTENRTPTLADAGIDKKLSSRAQRLAKMPESEFEAKLGDMRDGWETEQERISVNLFGHDDSPPMSASDLRDTIGIPREHIRVEARTPQDLKLPIIGARDLIATMKGYRALSGMSQLEADYRAGTQDGYIGKLELGMKQPFPNGAVPDGSIPSQSWWWWQLAYNLVMILVPAADVQPGKCPCCGQLVGQ